MFKEQVHKLTYDEVKIAIRDIRLYNQVHLPIVGEGVDARELPKLLLLMKPFTAVPLVIPVDDNPPFRASINVVNSCLKKNKVRGDFYPRVLSISLKFWFEVSEIPLYRMAHSSCTDQPWGVVTGMLVVLLRSENCRFWSHLG